MAQIYRSAPVSSSYTAPSSTIIVPTTILNLDALLRSPSSVNHNDTILRIDSLIASHHNISTISRITSTVCHTRCPLNLEETPSQLIIAAPEPALSLSQSPSLYRTHARAHSNPPPYPFINTLSFEFEPQDPNINSLDMESQSQSQSQPQHQPTPQTQEEQENDAPPTYPQHLTTGTNPPSPRYTKSDRRRGRKIRVMDVLRGRRRSEKVYWTIVGVLVALALGIPCFAVVLGALGEEEVGKH
ncbi:hypothetical protein BDW74DRAFT_177034 [Aspergillus multicolor]|uniref:uncharacterized protein n=1 Tax=Aspergillus multicolor TaxID=41759 RepID=UPI003CCDA92D